MQLPLSQGLDQRVIALRWQAALELRERLSSHPFYGGRALKRRNGPDGEEAEKDYWYSLCASLGVDQDDDIVYSGHQILELVNLYAERFGQVVPERVERVAARLGNHQYMMAAIDQAIRNNTPIEDWSRFERDENSHARI